MTKQQKTKYDSIIDWGSVSWYNYGGRLGMWYDFMDGIHAIEHLIKVCEEDGETDMVINLMAEHEILKQDMIKEEIWEGGILPEYKEKIEK